MLPNPNQIPTQNILPRRTPRKTSWWKFLHPYHPLQSTRWTTPHHPTTSTLPHTPSGEPTLIPSLTETPAISSLTVFLHTFLNKRVVQRCFLGNPHEVAHVCYVLVRELLTCYVTSGAAWDFEVGVCRWMMGWWEGVVELVTVGVCRGQTRSVRSLVDCQYMS